MSWHNDIENSTDELATSQRENPLLEGRKIKKNLLTKDKSSIVIILASVVPSTLKQE